MKKSLQRNFYAVTREWPYKMVRRRIIAEKYMESNKNDIPQNLLDYKFFCFDGEPKFLYLSDSCSHKMVVLNIEWTIADFGRNDYDSFENIPEKPDNLEEMLSLARKLSVGIPHVRVDLYNIDKDIYFGELTFYTASGFIPFNPKEYDGKLGDLLSIPNRG